MSDFADQLKRKQKVEEDLYFARRDRELLAAQGQRASRLSPETVGVISGGQTGVDRAALDAAVEVGLAVGGWCPAGRWAEDGPIPERYPLSPTPTGHPNQRTAWNVRDSDATFILHRGPVAGGTGLTLDVARRLARPVLLRDLAEPPNPAEIARWLTANRVRVLNCAGPRESEAPGIAVAALPVLREIFRAWAGAQG